MENLWQVELVMSALAGGEIDEAQAALLGVLYFNANWSTQTIRDFRAERLCEWTGHDATYVSTMRKRLQALREAGWFTWTYESGVKTPYDITMRRACEGEERAAARDGGEMRAPHAPGAPCEIPAKTLAGKNADNGNNVHCISESPITRIPCGSSRAGEARISTATPPYLLTALRKEVYEKACGTVLEQMLTPSQIDDMLSQFTPEEVGVALKNRWENVPAVRDFRRSLRAFLLHGLRLELDAAHEKLRKDFNRIKSARYYSDHLRKIMETPARVIERQKSWIEEHLDDFAAFPDVAYEAASLVYQQIAA